MKFEKHIPSFVDCERIEHVEVNNLDDILALNKVFSNSKNFHRFSLVRVNNILPKKERYIMKIGDTVKVIEICGRTDQIGCITHMGKTPDKHYLVEFQDGYTFRFHNGDLELYNNPTMALLVGDKVKLKPKSIFYGDSVANPANMIGEINMISDKDQIVVIWTNGESNIYSDYDLEVVTSSRDKPPIFKCTCELRKVVNFGCTCDAGQAELKKERA